MGICWGLLGKSKAAMSTSLGQKRNEHTGRGQNSLSEAHRRSRAEKNLLWDIKERLVMAEKVRRFCDLQHPWSLGKQGGVLALGISMYYRFMSVGKWLFLADRNLFHRFLRNDRTEQQSSIHQPRPSVLEFPLDLTVQLSVVDKGDM